MPTSKTTPGLPEGDPEFAEGGVVPAPAEVVLAPGEEIIPLAGDAAVAAFEQENYRRAHQDQRPIEEAPEGE